MNIVIAIDSLKGSLSSMEAGAAIKAGIHSVIPTANVTVCPLADGGEGTVEALVQGMNGRQDEIPVTGPLGTPVNCTYGVIPNGNIAVIEMAGAAGITLIPPAQRNPLITTTYGVGEVIKHAIQNGCRHFILGIGGSATNDGGIGMLQALGYEFLDIQGKPVSYGANGLSQITCIDDSNRLAELAECDFQIACDVTNPLYGTQGCSVIFGPQKGATPDMVTKMDHWMKAYAQLVKQKYPASDATQPGTGAAGGLGFAFLSFMNAVLRSGIEIVLTATKLEDKIRTADLVITGEGLLDAQTVMGKAPIGVAKLAKKYQKPVIAFAGAATPDAKLCNDYGIDAFFPILRSISSLEEAMQPKQASANLTDTTEQVLRLWNLRKSQ